MFLQERAAFAAAAPRSVISSFSTKLSLESGGYQNNKEKKQLRCYSSPSGVFIASHCFNVSERSMKVNFHSQEKSAERNMSQTLPSCLHTGHVGGMGIYHADVQWLARVRSAVYFASFPLRAGSEYQRSR